MAMAMSSLNFRAGASTGCKTSTGNCSYTLRRVTLAVCGAKGDDKRWSWSWSCSRREAIVLGSSCCVGYGAAFVGRAEVQEEPKLTVLDSGLGFRDARVGEGRPVAEGSYIKVNYTGKLEDGTEFETSYRFPQKPLSFRLGVGEVIDGWDLGILGGDGIPPMRTGGRRLLQIPASMAFGEEGVGCKKGKPLLTFLASLLNPGKDPSPSEASNQAPNCFIPPNATLFFDVELLDAFELPKSTSEVKKK